MVITSVIVATSSHARGTFLIRKRMRCSTPPVCSCPLSFRLESNYILRLRAVSHTAGSVMKYHHDFVQIAVVTLRQEYGSRSIAILLHKDMFYQTIVDRG